MTETLTEAERAELQRYLDACDWVHPSDETLHDYGPHRRLYDYITTELRFDCRPSRGAAYRRAELLLGENSD